MGSAESNGWEASVDWRPSDNVQLRANVTNLYDAQLTNDPPGLEGVSAGSRLPFAPEWKGSFLARFDWETSFFGTEGSFVQYQFNFVDESLNQVQAFDFTYNTPQMTMEAYSAHALKYGIAGGSWEANVFVNNLTDQRGELYHDNTDFYTWWGRQRTSIIRPREFGVRFVKFWQ